MNPTARQIEALRNVDVPEDRIQTLSIEQACEMLTGFVKHAGERKKDSPSSKHESILSEANLNLGGGSQDTHGRFWNQGQVRTERGAYHPDPRDQQASLRAEVLDQVQYKA